MSANERAYFGPNIPTTYVNMAAIYCTAALLKASFSAAFNARALVPLRFAFGTYNINNGNYEGITVADWPFITVQSIDVALKNL